MKLYPKHFPLALFVVLALALAACSGSSTEGPGSDALADADTGELILPDVGGDVTGDVTKDQQNPDADGTVLPGGFGAPCVGNDDCDSGFCTEGPNGYVCTQQCVTDCPTDYACRATLVGADAIFLCLPVFTRACTPCASDTQCAGGRCVDLDGRGMCVLRCDAEGGCVDPLYGCREVTSLGGASDSVCVPSTESCTCLGEVTAGDLRTCVVENDEGTCYGVEACDPATGWGACSAAAPVAEECNGVDDDCDGLIDNNLPAEQACSTTVEGIGTCPGQASCLGSLGWICHAPTPATETCDFLDNDCDGQTDEDFKTDGSYLSVEHCGTCQTSCIGLLPNADETCAGGGEIPPHCAVLTCDPGYVKANEVQCFRLETVLCTPCVGDGECITGRCVAFPGGSGCSTACASDEQAPGGYTCAPLDGQGDVWTPNSGACGCDSSSAGQTRPCTVTTDAGTCYGQEACNPVFGWVDCSARTPFAEVCNGQDDDCDGVVDEQVGAGEPCVNESEGLGACGGVTACLGPAGLVCNARQPKAEVCNHLDDDCDGRVDDGFATVDGVYDTDGDCGECGNDCVGAVLNGVGLCEVGPGGPRCVIASCDEGMNPVGTNACLPVPDVVCASCTDDAQCFGGTCREQGGASFCTRACTVDTPCPAGTHCGLFGDETSETCLPDSGSCDCSEAIAGQSRLCQVSTADGTCLGAETCDPVNGGWIDCSARTPLPDTCNGQDDDCNGAVDDGVPFSQPCERTVAGVGTCTGTALCTGSGPDDGYSCDAPEPEVEACDFRDNNCDGQTDEGFATVDEATGGLVYGDVHNCGTCGRNCAELLPHAVPACDTTGPAPTCVVAACEPGYYKASDVQCVPAPVVTCRPCDTDAQCFGGLCAPLVGAAFCLAECEPGGAACEPGYACNDLSDGRTACVPMAGSCDCSEANAGARRPCSSGNAYGVCLGFQSCDASAGWSTCDAAVPAPEVCNGLDDDCNGAVDDALPESVACEIANDAGTCTGVSFCQGKLGWTCQARVPAEETCNYVDDDCDGVTDDPFVTDGRYSTFEHCGSCGSSCAKGFPHATTVCDASGEVPECVVEACDPGYFRLNAYQCIPDLAKLCDPCATDENCIVAGARCVPVGDEGTFCGLPCETQVDCDAKVQGYVCAEYDGTRQCVPATGSCSCDGSKPGLQASCSATYGDGEYTCYGKKMCSANGWSACELPIEECNLADDDCDGATDEGFVDSEGHYASDENCGKCGNNCTLLVFGNAAGVCNLSASPVRCGPVCEPGFFDLDTNPNDCECHFLSLTDLPGADDPAFPESLDVNCDGVDGEVDNAIFVAKHGDDANPGTIELPVRTLHAGLQAAVFGGKRDVYVATGVYEEAVMLTPKVGVYGGYSGDFHVRNPALYQSAILAPAPTIDAPGAVNAIGISDQPSGSTVLDGFTVFAFAVRTPGGSSYGVYVRDCDDSVRITGNTLRGGAGGKGGRGVDGDDGPDGKAGGAGAAAFDLWERYLPTYTISHCSDLDAAGLARPTSPGGLGGSFTCGTTDVSGGAGGVRVCPGWDNLVDGPAAPTASEMGAPGKNGVAEGGAPGHDVFHQAYSCDGYSSFGVVEGANGGDGGIGTFGVAGTACALAEGAVSEGFWTPAIGSAGTSGSSGGGGAGGGSGGGAYVHTSCFSKGFGYDNFGGTGGGGGSGGCPGTAGQPGTSGGGAFTVFVVVTQPLLGIPILAGNELTTGFGGDGGDGGSGGVGGSGGLGGAGGAAGGGYDPPEATYPAFEGGKGGQGGQGGHGGGGGGGCGGPVFGLFVHGLSPADLAAWTVENSFVLEGTGGHGGLGGFSLGAPGQPGVDGAEAATNF